MSARIAPEPISIGITMGAEYSPRASRTTRPVEAVAATTADPQQNRSRTLADGDKARSGERPPGKDPSIPPQTLFDAALIASEFKPTTKVELPDPAEAETAVKASAVESDNPGEAAPDVQDAAQAPGNNVDISAGQTDSAAAA